MMGVQEFGEVNGTPVFEIAIASKAGASAKIITWGASVRDLIVPSRPGPQRVVLGLNTLADYQAYASHMGAIAGRFANRIAGGKFTLDGVGYQLVCNQGGVHSQHGGGKPFGFGVRPWTLVSHGPSSVTLKLHSPDGDAGYPGAMDVLCTYTLLEPSTLRVELRAVSDKPTVINLCHHSYFNLDGSKTILDHELMLPCQFRTPNHADLIPTGEIVAVVGTAWDFLVPQKIGARSTLYDANYLIDALPDVATGLTHCATVRSRKNGLALEVYTSEPCVQFYDAAKLAPPVAGLDGVMYRAHAGLCLEPQAIPDSPNRRHFSDCVLRPDGEYRQVTEYRFGSY
jgi:aldose 1-epimerase